MEKHSERLMNLIKKYQSAETATQTSEMENLSSQDMGFRQPEALRLAGPWECGARIQTPRSQGKSISGGALENEVKAIRVAERLPI